MMMNRIGTFTLAAFIGLAVAACSDSPGKEADDLPNNTNNSTNNANNTNNTNGSNNTTEKFIQAVPNPLQFVPVAIGQSETGTVRVFNPGEGVLTITSIELIEDTDSDEGGIEFHGDVWQDTAELQADEYFDLKVIYTPLDRSPDMGRIVITFDDGVFTIPISTLDISPNIYSNPNIVFQRVAPVTAATRDSNWQLTEVLNAGQAPLEITDVIIASGDFKVSYPTSSDIAADPATDAQTPPTVLQPDKSFPVRVYYNPVDISPSMADLIIFSNDPDSPQYVVKLQGNSGLSCIVLSREQEINFGDGGICFVSNKTITIENCSPTQDLEVSSIEISDDGGNAVFGIKDGSLPAALPGGSALIAPNNTASFIVTYTPTDTVVSNGELTVRSNDPSKATLTVPLVGKGTQNACPRAVAKGRVSNSSLTHQVSTVPLQTVSLDGTQSADSNGSITSYEWAIIQRPPNSSAQLQPSNTDSAPSLFLDLAGTYVVELTVFDDQGLANCSDDTTRRVTILAVANQGIHIELVWDTPSDADQTDAVGSDFDIHYLHPGGVWDQAPYDIFWRNGTADWGVPGGADDPSLDIDDTDGSGPEIISHAVPESGRIYTVGVLYYEDKGFGPSYATVRVYINGVQQYQFVDQYFPWKNMFWKAASISWPSGQITTINQMTTGFPVP